jgi:hypothetical protein
VVPIVDEDRGFIDPGTPDWDEAFRTRTTAAVALLRAGGRKVVILEETPVARPADDPLECLSKATFLDECRFVTHEGPTELERIGREVADADDVWSLDLDGNVCPYLPICDPIVDGLIVRRDDSHLSSRFTARLTPVFERFLDDNDVLG